MDYNCLIELNNCIKTDLPMDIIEIINEKVIINKVIDTPSGTIDYACMQNNFKLLKLYHKYNLPYTQYAIAYACLNGNLDMVIYLHNNFKFEKDNTYLSEMACKGGHLNIVKWVHKNEYKFSTLTLYFSELNNNINIINYICKNVKNIECCMIDLNISYNIGNFQIIQYIFNKIFNDNKNFVKYASDYGLVRCKRMIKNLIDNSVIIY
jgi:hypothetical protein